MGRSALRSVNLLVEVLACTVLDLTPTETAAGGTLMTSLDQAHLADLSARFSGVLLQAGDSGYDNARRIHNGMIDRRPALIARCLNTADIADAVNFARARGLELAVRGGGHNVAGRAVCDGGLMLDLSLMKGVQVDPVRRTARAQGGVTWREFNRETQLHGLATTGGVISTTGIAGLTLGGGLGWLMAKHGLAMDNLLSAEVVTASGEVIRASNDENGDLFWALRGGGGNFGVVSRFEYRLHPVGLVTSGLTAFPFERARDVLKFFREITSALSDDLTIFAGLLHAPDGARLAVILACHCGSPGEGEAALRPVKKFGVPVMDTIGPATYEATNTMLDAGFPRGALNYWKSSLIGELNDQSIDTLISQFAGCPSPMSALVLEHIHGAAARIGVSDTAFPHRREGYQLLVVSQWLDPAENARNIAWARESYDAMRPHFASGRYVNYLGEDEGEDAVEAAYGPNYQRLRALKAKYDPANLFHLNQNIPPGS
ncbi:MAG TPA: FAD-binding oxidoreductase [Candidatus Eisenbacteria bacterium]|nr:FAD-binding oxidoreductase [Candidatus Eisenbacteria bacterium]